MLGVGRSPLALPFCAHGFQFFPAGEGGGVLAVQFVETGFHLCGRAAFALIKNGVGEFCAEFGLFGFERVDLRGERVEFALFFVAEFARGLR